MPTWSFVGRAVELAQLTAAANAAPDRGVVVGGAAGVGKTRLLRQSVGALDADRLAVWTATATAATAELPLGALAPTLPPDQPVREAPVALLRWAVDALDRQAAGRPIVMAIDDVHLLDPLSGSLVCYLARARRATVLGTLRTGSPTPDPVRSLWTDDLVDRIELGPLTQLETADLLSGVLGGPVDSASVDRLWQLSQGNALLLRELVCAAQSAGEIIEQYGVHRWTGRPRLAPTLTEVIDARIGQLTPEVRAVLELTAFGEPIGLSLLVAATDQSAVETAEERGLIRVTRDGRRMTVRLAQPLYGEVVRRRCPVSRVRRLRAELAAGVEGVGARRRDDLLRVAVWRLDSDTARDPGLLLDACRQAYTTLDVPLAIRLGQAAAALDDGYDTAETLATILMFADRPAEAVRLLEQTEPKITTEAQRAGWLAVSSISRFWGLADTTTALWTARAAAAITDPANAARVRAVESLMRLHHGEYPAALTLARQVLDGPASPPGARALARATMAYLRAVRGAVVQAARAMDSVDADAARWLIDAPHIRLAVELTRGTATILSGDLPTADALVAAGFAGSARAGDFQLGSGYLSVVAAQAARLRGALPEAARSAGQAAVRLQHGRVFAGLAHAERAHAAALAGAAAEAAEAMAEADRAHEPTMTVLYPWIESARCWVVACSATPTGAGGPNGVARAIALAGALAERLRADELLAHEVVTLHDLVRLGAVDRTTAGIVERLAVLAAIVEGRYPPLVARQARALADGDGEALLAVADDFHALGMRLYAAEAAMAAVTLLRTTRSGRTQQAIARLTELYPAGAGWDTPALRLPQPALTVRERQVARLAAAGVPSKEIAERLFLSSRTVDNHLMRVYAKLGVAGRGELAASLAILPPDDD